MVEVLSDGSIVTSEVYLDNQRYLNLYDQTNGKELSSRCVKHWAGGLVEVRLGGKRCLAISCRDYMSDQGEIR